MFLHAFGLSNLQFKISEMEEMNRESKVVRPFTDAAVHDHIATLKDAFRDWHHGSRPPVALLQPAGA